MPRAAAADSSDVFLNPSEDAEVPEADIAAADGLGAADTVIEANSVAAVNKAMNFFIGLIPPFPFLSVVYINIIDANTFIQSRIILSMTPAASPIRAPITTYCFPSSLTLPSRVTRKW